MSVGKSLPNVLSCNVTKNIGICNKHFPLDCPRVIKKPGGSLVPTVPPSIFGTTKTSLFVQTTSSPRIAITAESRRLRTQIRELEVDKINSFSQIHDYCLKFSPEHAVIRESQVTKIIKLNGWPPEVEYSVLISEDYHVIAYRKHFKVDTRDLEFKA